MVGEGTGLGDSLLSSSDPLSIGEGVGAIVSPVREWSVVGLSLSTVDYARKSGVRGMGPCYTWHPQAPYPSR